MPAAPILIDGFRPLSLVTPHSADEIGDLIRRAAAENYGLYPIGGATALDFGMPPRKPGDALDLRGLDQVIDYPARDMTITVRAGITIAKLQSILSREQQRLPVDIPMPDAATLGGAIAVNASGPRRYGFGTLRDYVIGISFMTNEGTEAKAGGRVVKNVAGYDLCKLHIGALGTLGIVTQLTLKLRPVPECSVLLASMIRIADLSTVLDGLHQSKTRPTCLEIESVHSLSECRLTIGFEQSDAAVRWEIEQLGRELSWGELGKLEGESAEREWRRLTDSLCPADSKLSFKARMLPSVTPHFLAKLTESPAIRWQAHAGNGIVIGHWDGDHTQSEAVGLLAKLRELAVAGRGGVVVTRCPPQWKSEIRIWDEPRGDVPLMRRVKQALDPHDLFNPGRLSI